MSRTWMPGHSTGDPRPAPAFPERTTDWIMTASGRPFWPLEPRVEDVCIEDIAHHLSNLCRFTGAVRTFYSVAQHSVLVSRCLMELFKAAGASRVEQLRGGLYGQLHDGSEAYLIDVPRPVKRDPQFRVYRQFEATLQAVIYRAFNLALESEPADLKLVDMRLLRTEHRDLMPQMLRWEAAFEAIEPYEWRIAPQTPEIARAAFLDHFHSLQAALALSTWKGAAAV